ncbi:MAG TPA: translation initiation factor IF-2 [Candidatus Cloacimonas sp.]|nr:translation initiation factor IF-2 [Candidatus Cloacimonas sp.]
MQIRAHELAKELKISTMALRKHLEDLGVTIKSHMSLVDPEVAEKIRIKYKEQMDAEKRAERERKKVAEMRRAARKKEKEAAAAATEAEAAPKKKTRAKAKTEEKAEEKAEDKAPAAKAKEAEEPKKAKAPAKKAEPAKAEEVAEAKEPEVKKPEAPKHRIIVPHTQATPIKPRKPRAKPKSYLETQAAKDEPARAKEKPKREAKARKAAPVEPKTPPPIPAPSKEVESKKFGKTRQTPDDLGEKSRHKKAMMGGARRSKQRMQDPSEMDEAVISRNIKRVMQKSSKRKKYQRETQHVQAAESQIVVREFTSVSELAKIINVPAAEIISKFFMLGQLVTINQRLDRDSLELVCDEFKVDVQFADEYGMDIIDEEQKEYEDVEHEPRPPVVTIMGHVDHGKTSILDYIRNENIVAGESGGITQHIGAYQIEVNKHKITFLDTPGHEAFTAMRSRGANVTDIAVIVVSAVEGIMPQTKEAIDHAKAAGVQLIVAINKVDLQEANVDRVVAQLLDYGVYLEQYGGDVPWCKTSVVTGEGILNLIELIILQAEVMELTAQVKVPAEAVVIESQKDTRVGTVATILMQRGTLKKGNTVVCGATYGNVRRMEDERGNEILELKPSDVARMFGLNDAPKAGDILNEVESERMARNISSERSHIRAERERYQNKASLQNIFDRIKQEETNTLNIILKTDTDGSSEALADSFLKLSNPEVQVNIIHKSVGGISEVDVNLASASDAVIIGFHVRANQQARRLAEEEGVQIKIYQVIYDAIEDLRAALEGMLSPILEEEVIGSATVKQIFKIKKVGIVAGCQVDRGAIRKNCKVRLYRNDVLIAEDDLSSLQHYADEVAEVRAGTDCGISLKSYSDIKEGDVLECFVIKEIAQKLS